MLPPGRTSDKSETSDKAFDKTYTEVVETFRWAIPQQFNIAQVCCERWADGRGRPAIIHAAASGAVTTLTFDALNAATNRLANLFLAQGIQRGDRIAILLSQRPETAIAHLACQKIGAIAVPLFVLFQTDALRFRLGDSGARAIVTDAENWPKIEVLRIDLPLLKIAVVINLDHIGTDTVTNGALIDWDRGLAKASDRFTAIATHIDEPALIIYTSGTTGSPKGALHAQRVLLGHLPGVEFPHEFFPQPNDLFWTPADWAWIGGLLDVLLPSLYHGVPVLAQRMAKFDPEAAFRLMAQHKVRNSFLPPTALKLMRVVPQPQRFGATLRSIGSGGESLGAEILDWGRAAFGLTINEFYGQTECNLVIGNCARVMPIRPGAMGRAIPGHDVAILDEHGHRAPPGTLGEIGVRRPDPVMFLHYWQNATATKSKFRGNWLLTGDLGRQDDDGYFHYVGRSDDVITTAGYRVGPGEVEDCLLKHPAVAMAAVVGLPDPVRTESIAAFLVLKSGFAKTTSLALEIQTFVKTRLAAHAYPRRVEFLDQLPMTATGKIIRRALRDRYTECTIS
ncbi:MAG: acyl-CoA synthetase [Alphaproteobacteria bacterium]